jgi:hypothetical protein
MENRKNIYNIRRRMGMKKILSVLLFVITVAAFSVNAQASKDAEKKAMLSVSDEEVVKFINAFPEFLKENKDLNPSDASSVTAAMTTIAANKDKWEAFAKDKGFTSYENFLKVTTAVTTAYAYQLLQHNSGQLEKQIAKMPEAAQAIAKAQMKPAREQINQYSKMISPETLEVVKNHMDELQKVFIPAEKTKSKKK